VGFDIEVSVGQVIQFLGTLCTKRKECIMWRLCVSMDPASVAKLFVGFP